jgi:hypothetical protein
MPQIRRGELRRRRVRRKRLAALRYRYANAEDEAEKARVLKIGWSPDQTDPGSGIVAAAM